MGYSIDPITDDCYEGTTCLINKFGIADEKKLVLSIISNSHGAIRGFILSKNKERRKEKLQLFMFSSQHRILSMIESEQCQNP